MKGGIGWSLKILVLFYALSREIDKIVWQSYT